MVAGILIGVLLSARHSRDDSSSRGFRCSTRRRSSRSVRYSYLRWASGVASKIAIIFLTAVFPIIINTVTGLTTTDRNLIEAARSFGATPMQIQFKVRVPGALPFIIAGLRLGVARALVGVVVAELFGARAGLGFLILTPRRISTRPRCSSVC